MYSFKWLNISEKKWSAWAFISSESIFCFTWFTVCTGCWLIFFFFNAIVNIYIYLQRNQTIGFCVDSPQLFNIQITPKDIFIFHYFWYIQSHVHKLQFISNKLRKCSNSCSCTEVKNKVFPSSWKTDVIPTVVLPPS